MERPRKSEKELQKIYKEINKSILRDIEEALNSKYSALEKDADAQRKKTLDEEKKRALEFFREVCSEVSEKGKVMTQDIVQEKLEEKMEKQKAEKSNSKPLIIPFEKNELNTLLDNSETRARREYAREHDEKRSPGVDALVVETMKYEYIKTYGGNAADADKIFSEGATVQEVLKRLLDSESSSETDKRAASQSIRSFETIYVAACNEHALLEHEWKKKDQEVINRLAHQMNEARGNKQEVAAANEDEKKKAVVVAAFGAPPPTTLEELRKCLKVIEENELKKALPESNKPNKPNKPNERNEIVLQACSASNLEYECNRADDKIDNERKETIRKYTVDCMRETYLNNGGNQKTADDVFKSDANPTYIERQFAPKAQTYDQKLLTGESWTFLGGDKENRAAHAVWRNGQGAGMAGQVAEARLQREDKKAEGFISDAEAHKKAREVVREEKAKIMIAQTPSNAEFYEKEVSNDIKKQVIDEMQKYTQARTVPFFGRDARKTNLANAAVSELSECKTNGELIVVLEKYKEINIALERQIHHDINRKATGNLGARLENCTKIMEDAKPAPQSSTQYGTT